MLPTLNSLIHSLALTLFAPSLHYLHPLLLTHSLAMPHSFTVLAASLGLSATATATPSLTHSRPHSLAHTLPHSLTHALPTLPAQLLPSHYTSLRESDRMSERVSERVSAGDPTGYFVANVYSTSTDCTAPLTHSHTPSYKFATATGVCFVGMTNNTATGSLAYSFEGVASEVFMLTRSEWSSLDCSGTHSLTTIPLPTTCIVDDTGLSSVAYTYSVGATPWTQYAPGFMFQ
jgi:hypothetical protein